MRNHKMNILRWTKYVAVLAVLAMGVSVHAAVVVFEDFGGIADGSADGTSGSGSFGWTDTWEDLDGEAGNATAILNEAAWSQDVNNEHGGIKRTFTSNAGESAGTPFRFTYTHINLDTQEGGWEYFHNIGDVIRFGARDKELGLQFGGGNSFNPGAKTNTDPLNAIGSNNALTLTIQLDFDVDVDGNEQLSVVAASLADEGAVSGWADIKTALLSLTTTGNIAGNEIGDHWSIYKRNLDSRSILYDNLTIDAVPEPASMVLLGMGGLMMLRRR